MSQYKVRVGEKDFVVHLVSKSANSIGFTIDGQNYLVNVNQADICTEQQSLKRPFQESQPNTPKSSAPKFSVDSGTSSKQAGGPEICSPMPGIVLDIKVKEGVTVVQGQTLVIIEAMKMENNIIAPRAGVVRNIKVQNGQEVNSNQVLLHVDNI